MPDYREHLLEACNTLGLVRPEAVGWMAELIDRYDYEAARLARTMGTPMDSADRKKLKLGNLKMSMEAWDALTDKGRSEPGSSIDFTIRRAMASFRRRQEWNDIMADPTIRTVEVSGWNACNAMEAFRAATPFIPKSAAPSLPLPGCARAVCECRISRHWQSDGWQPAEQNFERTIVLNVDPVPRPAPEERSMMARRSEAEYRPVRPQPPPVEGFDFFGAFRNVLAAIGAIAIVYYFWKR